ncbi:RNA polymerase II-associated protein 3-like [Pseudomyrmex gracilis]|uniref:RNA polymerase II-associated protein 3-like n=1 Tax=Pseudomyrmex gracilis TaxID=219809 RepID=UPI00099535AD|nr:RNA polymerase II-associated protein 3-like [Pseudomyrmex gracilis]
MMELDQSILLQKQVRNNSEDLHSEFLDLKNWEEEMKRKERELINEHDEQHSLPPVRSKIRKTSTVNDNKTTTKKTTDNSKKIRSFDYSAWDKFDVEKACEEVDKNEESDDSAEEPMLSKEELEKNHSRATTHKEEGNIFVQQKNWSKALASYNEAIKIFPYDAVFYANRALCHLKLNNLYSAEADCSSAIQLDDNYVKAYHRRAVARMELKQYKEAKEDVQKLLILQPSDKEAKVMLRQIDKHLEHLQPTIIREDIDKNISLEKRIAEKMLGDVKLNRKVSDTKEDKNRKNSINVEAAKPPSVPIISETTSKTITSTTESKKDKRIPDWLPEKDNVEIVEAIQKLPHLRSKEPLKRILVQEADLSKPFKEKDEKLNYTTVKAELTNTRSDNSANNKKETISQNTLEENYAENDIEIPPVPKTAVQFLVNWKKCTTSDVRYKYLKQISPDSLPNIFQDSMESDIFSSILKTLKEFMERQQSVFSYLKNLSNIKRFRALIMFLSNAEKQDLKLILTYCKTTEKISTEEIVELQNKYEI